MAGRADDPRSPIDGLERVALAALGVVALTAERAEQLVDELVERGGLGRDEARSLVDDVASRWRGEAVRLGERFGSRRAAAFKELGLVTRDEYEELELRVAQLEHRLRLVEGEPRFPLEPPPSRR
jgi:polyhydroxyalkanoate synthesis regulator phasin